jgi:hypothetical protein
VGARGPVRGGDRAGVLGVLAGGGPAGPFERACGRRPASAERVGSIEPENPLGDPAHAGSRLGDDAPKRTVGDGRRTRSRRRADPAR